MDALGIEGGLLVSQIVNFLLMIAILSVTLYRPVLRMLDTRRERIAQSMKDAERAGAAAQEAEADKAKLLDAARREAQEVRAQATRDAEKIAQDIRSRAEQEATDIRIKAQADAQKQADAMVADANKRIVDLTIDATEALLGRELASRTDSQRFVEEFLQRNGSAAQ